MGLIFVIIVIAVVAFMIFGNIQTAKVHSEISQDPLARQYLLDPIERWGKYDGSAASERKAQEAMDVLERHLPPASSRTMRLYRAALKKNLYIPLAATYAYAVGEYLENPMVPLSGHGTQEANMKVAGTRALFPALYNIATTEHSPRNAEAAICIATNLLEYFLDSDAIRSRFS